MAESTVDGTPVAEVLSPTDIVGIKLPFRTVRVDGARYGDIAGNRALIGTPAYLTTSLGLTEVDVHEAVHLWQAEHLFGEVYQIPGWVRVDGVGWEAIALGDSNLENPVKATLSELGINDHGNFGNGLSRLAIASERLLANMGQSYNVDASLLYWACRNHVMERADRDLVVTSDYSEAVAIFLARQATGRVNMRYDPAKEKLVDKLASVFGDPRRLVTEMEELGAKQFYQKYFGEGGTGKVGKIEAGVKEVGGIGEQVLALAAYEVIEKHSLGGIDASRLTAASQEYVKGLMLRYMKMVRAYWGDERANTYDGSRVGFFLDRVMCRAENFASGYGMFDPIVSSAEVITLPVANISQESSLVGSYLGELGVVDTESLFERAAVFIDTEDRIVTGIDRPHNFKEMQDLGVGGIVVFIRNWQDGRDQRLEQGMLHAMRLRLLDNNVEINIHTIIEIETEAERATRSDLEPNRLVPLSLEAGDYVAKNFTARLAGVVNTLATESNWNWQIVNQIKELTIEETHLLIAVLPAIIDNEAVRNGLVDRLGLTDSVGGLRDGDRKQLQGWLKRYYSAGPGGNEGKQRVRETVGVADLLAMIDLGYYLEPERRRDVETQAAFGDILAKMIVLRLKLAEGKRQKGARYGRRSGQRNAVHQPQAEKVKVVA